MEQKHQQKEACEQYAKEHGMKVEAVYNDAEAVRERIEAGGFDALIVTHRSRISRNYLEYEVFKLMMKEKGIKIINLNEL